MKSLNYQNSYYISTEGDLQAAQAGRERLDYLVGQYPPVERVKTT